jgi:hypothetical protein
MKQAANDYLRSTEFSNTELHGVFSAMWEAAPDSEPLSEGVVLDLFHRYTVTNHEGMEVTDIYKFASAIGNLLCVNHTT